MRITIDGAAWDRCMPAFVIPYAVWTVYVHALVAMHASFTTLLHGLPLVATAAVAATLGWARLGACDRPPAAAAARAIAGRGRDLVPFAVLAFAALCVGLLSAGMPYPVFWAAGLLLTGAAWCRSLRGAADPPRHDAAGTHGGLIVACVAVAAVCIVLAANRPAADDGFYLSIPATLLRFPEQPILLHDTMYRLPGSPILLPFYRLGNYGVLAAVLARLGGIDHLVVAYLVLPALFAVLGVLAWVHLLRRIVPERWPMALAILFACVLALGEANRAYGNFAFLRLFHGKAVLATGLVPASAGAALAYMRQGGMRYWLLLFATQVAALGVAASAVFVAPAAAALALAGGWSADRAHSRRFALGLLASAYLFAAAWATGSGDRGTHALAVSSALPMPGILHILRQTWGPWSTRILLVALLAAWAFARERAQARFFAAGAFCFLLVALNPYTTPFVAAVSVGAKTYWRLTWALPLPFFLAVVVEGLLARALAARKTLALGTCAALVAGSAVFGARSGTLRSANVALGWPGLKVPTEEYAVARMLAGRVPETGVVLAPEEVARWVPIFVSHPELVGVRQMYLSSAFAPAETAQRSNLMRYVGGTNRPPDAQPWFAEATARRGVSAIVFTRAALWGREIGTGLAARGWRTLACGRYVVMVRGEGRTPGTFTCIAEPVAIRR
jgi:hypothetical protein